jgi:sugar phosphate isomerase/epimerase
MAASVPISVQLYSLRAEAALDFSAVLRRLGAIGFVGVELAGFHDLTPAHFATVASDSGLVVSSAHVGDVSPDAFRATLDDLQSVGCDTVIQAFIPPADFTDIDTVLRRADALNVANEIARERGVTVGYHNHWWEFENSFDGRLAWDVFFERLDPTIVAELDLYWATVGGADPKSLLQSMGERIRFLHVKDGPADDPQSAMVAVGTGSVDIGSILGATTDVQWHVVELDRCDTDMFTAIEGSYRYLTANGLSRGRV